MIRPYVRQEAHIEHPAGRLQDEVKYRRHRSQKRFDQPLALMYMALALASLAIVNGGDSFSKEYRISLGITSMPLLTAVALPFLGLALARAFRQAGHARFRAPGAVTFGLAALWLLSGVANRPAGLLRSAAIFGPIIAASLAGQRVGSPWTPRVVRAASLFTAVVTVLSLLPGRGLASLPANANYSALALAPGAIFLMRSPRWPGRICGVAALLVLWQDSRTTTLIALCAGMLVAFVARSTRAYLAGLILITVALGTSWLVLGGTIDVSVPSQNADGVPFYAASADRGGDFRRAILGRQAVAVAKQEFLLGVGPENLPSYLNSIGVSQRFIAQPHNVLFRMAAELGLIGALLVMLLLLKAARCSTSPRLAAGESAVLLAVLVNLFGNDYYASPSVWLSAWLIGATLQTTRAGT